MFCNAEYSDYALQLNYSELVPANSFQNHSSARIVTATAISSFVSAAVLFAKSLGDGGIHDIGRLFSHCRCMQVDIVEPQTESIVTATHEAIKTSSIGALVRAGVVAVRELSLSLYHDDLTGQLVDSIIGYFQREEIDLGNYPFRHISFQAEKMWGWPSTCPLEGAVWVPNARW